jgi:hypothetical protein
MTDEYRPKSRLSELLVERVADDLLVLDQKNAVGHCLNQAAAAVLEKCDGTRSEEDIRHAIETEVGSPVAPVIVTYALQELGLKRLLEPRNGESGERLESSSSSSVAAPATRIRRRDLMKQMGAAALLVPAVTTVLVPTPAMAQSAVAAAPAPAPAAPAPIIGIPGAPAGAVLVATP